ncbi:hypothetical protein AB0B85_14370 [Micromonospora sp. NPDC049044]|uniref:hypothetical protein n=1 Tax=Micromonospora sp. NPDC049044 TaxID=3154827 RepID=UPI0033D6A671
MSSASSRFGRRPHPDRSLREAVAVEEGPCAALVRDPSFRAVAVGWLARGGGTAAWRPITLSLVAADPADPEPLRAVLTGGIPLHSACGFADDLEELLRTRPDEAGPMRRLLAAVDATPAWRVAPAAVGRPG